MAMIKVGAERHCFLSFSEPNVFSFPSMTPLQWSTTLCMEGVSQLMLWLPFLHALLQLCVTLLNPTSKINIVYIFLIKCISITQ